MSQTFDPWRTGALSLDVMAVSRSGAKALERRRSERLAALLTVAARDSPLYRRLIGRRTPSALRLDELPPMNKTELMRQFDEWVCDPLLGLAALRDFTADRSRIGEHYLGRYLVWESSGSSGEPGVFVQDLQAQAVYDVLEALRRPPLQVLRRWWDPFYLSERIAFVGATTGHFATTVTVERLRRLNPVLASNMRSLSFLRPTAELVAELNEFRPTVVATYPTAALLLAEQAEAGRLHIEPKEIWTGGETLTPATRRYVQQRLQCPVSNSYGASEFLAMAAECREGRLHLNSDWLILESVDAHHRPVPAGEAGHTTLLTNLANHVQPIIRYDLGDRVTFSPHRCSCGSVLPVIEVEGRKDDALLLRDEQHQPVRLLPLAVTTVLEDDAGVFDFQLLQEGERTLELCVTGEGASGTEAVQRASQALKAYLLRQGLAGVRVHAHCVTACARGRSGKVQRVVAGRSRPAARAA